MSHIFNPRTLLNNTGPVIDYTIIVHGSKPGDHTMNDDRYATHERGVEIVVHPRLPRKGMTAVEIEEFCRLFTGYQ